MAEEIVMTPSKKDDTTIINIEKVEKKLLDESQIAHKAGGQNAGLVINKQLIKDTSDTDPHHLQLEFKCFLVDQKSGKHIPELRCLKFWFPDSTEYLDKVTSAYDFFRELVKPEHFPRDYVGFIKKVMKGMQHKRYSIIKRIQVDMRHLKAEESVGVNLGESEGADKRPKELIVQDQLLLSLESAFPNVLPTETLLDMLKADEGLLVEQLKLLLTKNLVKELEPGRWVRNVLDNKSELRIVKNLTGQVDGSKPTIAIITSKYYEKVAVDAMMEKKTSFVRFKSEGESNVYTIGYIGTHKVVSTKLPMIGRKRDAQISSGNTTTRLLGTFGEIEHILLVGVCGGVPQYADFYKHVRLGDIILSASNNSLKNTHNNGSGANGGGSTGEAGKVSSGGKSNCLDDCFYLYCDKVTCEESNINNTTNNNNSHNSILNSTYNSHNNSSDNSPAKLSLNGGVETKDFSVKGWCPEDHVLLKLAKEIAMGGGSDGGMKNSNGGDVSNNVCGGEMNGSLKNGVKDSVVGGCNGSGEVERGWQKYLLEGQQQLEGQEVKFSRPSPETDRLFMRLGGDDVIEVGHPVNPATDDPVVSDKPTIRFGLIGSGNTITSDDQLRLDFASKYNCLAFDSEIDQVLESIEGSRKESYIVVRGVADYREGERAVEWQAYAALAAASFMKELIEKLP